ncbi:DUF1499 domain-containing protein [Henriciella aquimarina]|uniref:DUF1499 domain-containing protein n=1 Tax=Henriciella aquimarina TaxID=545261 RepID=UPI0009FEB01A|nr:DUF1499 domain-containing protein [Henriciella aquimarina]
MSERVDFHSLRRPASPNTYLLAPEGFCQAEDPDAISPVFATAPDALFGEIATIISGKERWDITLRDDTARHIEAIAKTKLLKFKDDVAIEVVPVDGKPDCSQLAIYSRSRVGYHDLGANRKRVEALIGDLTQKR